MEKNTDGGKGRKQIWLIGIGAVIVAAAAIGIAVGKKSERGKGVENDIEKDSMVGIEGQEEMESQGQDGENLQGRQSDKGAGVQNNENGKGDTGEAEEGRPIIAMYIPLGERGHIFVGEQAGVFTVTFPDEIYDVNGNKITKDELVKGNIVKIYGNEMMLESYPGQYPGVTKMIVAEEGEPSDADVYQNLIDEIYQEPDPAEPPSLNVEYTTDLAMVMVIIGRGGYEWVYMDEDGTSNAVVADSAHVLDWKEIADIVIDKSVDLTLYFSTEPQEVEVVRYDSSFSGKAQEQPEGEKIAIEKKDGKWVLSNVTAGYVYDVTGIWENGRANYGFITVPRD